MKRKQYRRKSVQCPFYKKEDRQTIYCSGVMDNTSTHIAFGHDAECTKYKDTVCGIEYKRCKVFQMLEEVYNGG